MLLVFYIFDREKEMNKMSDIWMVTEGTTLECTMGTMTSKLQVPMTHGSGISGKIKLRYLIM